MKLHLPARLRSALLACMAVLTPLSCTVATGALTGLGAVAALASFEAQAVEIQVDAGSTVDYASGNTYVLNGGTLNIADGSVSTAIKVNSAESTVNVATGAKLSPLYVSLAEGVESYKLAGSGLYDLGTATNMYGASISATGWTGVTSIKDSTGVTAFNFNTYGTASSVVKVSGVAGWMALGVAFNPTVWLEDAADGSSAFLMSDGSSNREYSFNSMKGAGTFERGGSKFSGKVTFTFRGDVSEWTGNFVNNYGTSNLVFNGSSTLINLGEVVNNTGNAFAVSFNGASATEVNTKIHSSAGGALNLTVSNSAGVTFNNEVIASTLTVANAPLTVGKSGSLTVTGAAELGGALVVEGVASLQGGATVSKTIENSGVLTIAGTLNVNSAGLRQTSTGDSTFSDGDNGVLESGKVQYYVVENASGAQLQTGGATLNFDGSTDLTLEADGTVLRNKVTGDTTYWVNKGDVSFAATNAASYRMNGGTLVLDKTDAAQQGQALAAVVGDEGTVKLVANASLTGDVSTKASSALLITDGATLSIGNGKGTANYASSFSSVTLDNGKLAINALPGTIQNLTVTTNNGGISFPDYMNAPTESNAYMFSGITQLDGKLTVTGSYKFVARFNRLSGAGSLEFNGPTSGETMTQLLIDSLQGFSGDLAFVQNNGSNPYYKVTLSSGDANVSMNSITMGKGAAKSADQQNIDVLLKVQSGKTMTLAGALTMQSNLGLSVEGAAGLKLEGGLIVLGQDNTLTILDDSAMDLSALQVTNGASLVAKGLVSALSMNQAGSLVRDELKIQDGGRLVYNADETVLTIGGEMLLGGVKVDLNSLTAAQSTAIVQGTPFDLGIDGAVSESLISTLSDNIRDIKMEVVDGTWKVTGGVVSMYWEGGSANWTDAAKWAFRDGATPTQAYLDGTDAIFSGDTATVSVADVKTANIEVVNGDYTFNYDFIGDTVEVGNDLIVGAGAKASFNNAGASVKNMTVGGDVSVGENGSLSISMDSVAVSGALKGAGSATVNSDLSLGASSDIGELKVSGGVSMSASAAASRNLSVGGSSTAASLSGVEQLTVKDGGSMSVTAGTTLSSLAGEGSFSTSDLTLSKGASSIGSLTVDSLSLNKGVTLEAGTLAAPQVDMVFSNSVVDGTPLVSAGQTVGDIAATVTVESTDDLSKLTNGMEVTVLTTGQAGGSLSAEWNVIPSSPDINVSDDKQDFSVTSNLRGFGYTLTTNADNTAMLVVVGRDNDGWIGSESDTWTQGEQTGWEVNFIPNTVDRAAGFFGNGSSVVNIDAAGVQTALVDVDINMKLLETHPSYTFVGGQVTTDNMIIGQGELIIANKTVVSVDTEVYTNGKLTVAEGGQLKVGSNLSLTDDVALGVAAGGVLSVGGVLSAEKDVTIANDGFMSVGSVDVVGTITNNELEIADGGSVGRVEGGSVLLLNDSAVLELGSADIDTLSINGQDSTVSLSEDSTIGLLTGDASKAGKSLVSSAGLTLLEAAEGAVNVTASALTLNSIGNEFGVLNAPVVTMALEPGSLSSTEAVVSVQSLVTVNPMDIILTQGTIEALPVGEGNVIEPSDYKLIAGITGHTLADFNIADSIMQEIKRRGVTAELKLSAQKDELLLSIGAIEGGMTWDTSEGNVTNNGYVIPTGAGLYKALDYVEHVVVKDNKTIDLTAEGVGSAATDASIPSVGLIIRDLNGGGKLTLLGDAAAEDGTLPDIATLISSGETASPVDLVADSLVVNVGLPEGVEGILPSDVSPATQVLASADLTNGAVLQVNTDAEVEGDTSLTDGASVLVAEGATLTTAKLDGDATAVVGGNIVVDGVGGYYDGSYAASGAQVSLGKGAYQTIKAGTGLSLTVAGGEGTLNLGNAPAEMTHLGLGSDKEDSQLILNNTTVDEKAGTVTQHKLSLTGADSYIRNAEMTFSLGAEATAATLGSDKVPVIIDGRVDIKNSDFVVTMLTANENLRALDVAPDAPLKDAVLAQLVTDASVSGSNEVTLTGTRAMQALLSKYYTNARLASDGTIRVDRVDDYYSSAVTDLSETGTVGMEMMDQTLLHVNPQANAKEYRDLAAMMNALDDAIQTGNTGEVDRLASAATGASVASLAMALSGDVERQLRAIRNRTTTMGVDQSAVNHNMPYFNAWINAEVDNRKMDQDGMLPGYDYTSTGGTLGFDVDVTPRFTFGVAFSSLRGDFSSESADQLEADVETFYISGFARATYRRWTHTFVATFGKSDLSMDRTVTFSGGSYQTQGDTEAFNFGVMYEMGYVMALDVDGTSCLQPVFNISLARSTMDAYTERGSDAALSVGDSDLTMLTIGAGARLQSVVGENLFNRSSIFEARALIKLNAGDREGSVENGMVSVPSATGSLNSAERDAISLELGAGVTIPIGAISGSIFVDGAAELGSGYTGVNATVGYRLNF